MNARSVNLVLLAVCLGLTGTLLFTLRLLRQARDEAPVEAHAGVITNTVKNNQIIVRKINASNYLAAFAKRPLSWAGLESTNYYAYVENLRAFGCPEETIRDIILTDIAKIFARQRMEILSGADYRFWQPAGEGMFPELRARLVQLDQEQDRLVRDLLNVDFEREMLKYWGGQAAQTRWKLSFLPQEKQDQVLAVQQKYEEYERSLYDAAGGSLNAEDLEQLGRLQQLQREELAGLLTPGELEDYELRFSAAADGLRSQMAGLNPTEQEFRSLFQLQRIYDQTLQTALAARGPLTPEVRALAELQAADVYEKELQKSLGPDRYDEFVRSRDEDYRQLLTVTAELGLPETLANRAYDMRQEALQQKEQVESNPNLSLEQRGRALLALASETERSLTALLGERPFQTYRRLGGDWMDTLWVAPEPPPQPEPAPPPEFPPLPFSTVPY